LASEDVNPVPPAVAAVYPVDWGAAIADVALPSRVAPVVVFRSKGLFAIAI
jgi:hypothetical protein